MSRAPLASGEFFIIKAPSSHDDVTKLSDSKLNASLSSSSYLIDKNCCDEAKLIELNKSVKVCNDNVFDIAPRDEGSAEVNVSFNIPSAVLTNEAWLAPFQDCEVDRQSVMSSGLQTGLPPTSSSSSPSVGTNDAVKSEDVVTRDCVTSKLPPRDRLYNAAVSVKAAVHFSRMQKIKQRARWFTKKFIVFMLSHVGLTTLVALYAVAGGFIFQRLESNMNFDNPHIVHVDHTHKSRAIRSAAVLNNFSAITTATFQAIRDQHVAELWNLTESLNVLNPDLWKVTVSQDLHEFEQEIYQIILRKILAPTEDRTHGKEQEMEHHLKPTEWNYPSALLFAVTVITTIGYGDTVPKSWEAKMVCIVYALFGIPLTLLCLANLGSLLASVYKFTWKHAYHLALIIVRAPERNNPLVATSQVRVPITISLSTMIVYILGGAAIFSEWENWTFLEGSYFCFITLSTIGFGDYVPGKDTETLDSNAKRVVCAIYLLFGLALLSMIFQLIQDSVTIVVGRYASFLGLSEAQIQRDIIESIHEDENKGEIRREKSGGSTEQRTRNGVQVGGNARVVEIYAKAAKELVERRDK